MPRRRAGVLLAIEESILEVALRYQTDGVEFYGFALAEALSSRADGARLLGHGTLYKALGRLEQRGLLESRWEDVDTSAQGRPRRRLYRVTGHAAAALSHSRLQNAPTATLSPQRWAPT